MYLRTYIHIYIYTYIHIHTYLTFSSFFVVACYFHLYEMNYEIGNGMSIPIYAPLFRRFRYDKRNKNIGDIYIYTVFYQLDKGIK